jgi:hypothetical protein
MGVANQIGLDTNDTVHFKMTLECKKKSLFQYIVSMLS